jgi:hypothetical protein
MKWNHSSADMSFSYVCLLVAIVLALLTAEKTASAAEINYVTGGSIDLAYGTSAIKVRKNADGEHGYYLTFGGPAIKLSFPDESFSVSASFFPSLRYIPDPDQGTNNVSVTLGFGPSFGYKNWIVSLPSAISEPF